MKKKLGTIIAIMVIIFIIIFFSNIINLIINIEWFKEVGYLSVFFTRILAIIKLMVPIFLISYISIWLYYKSLRKSILKFKNIIELDSKKRKIEKRTFFVINIVISAVISCIFSSQYWYRILQFSNSVDFKDNDPIFSKEVSFYIFKLPLIQSLYEIFMTLLIFLILITLVIFFIMNARDKILFNEKVKNIKGINAFNNGITRFAGRQLAVVSALIMMLLSLGYMIKSWNLVYSPRGVAFGASYTDVHVTLIFYRVIIVLALIASIVIFLSILKSKVKPIIISISAIIIIIIAEGVSSNLIQNFIVKSNENTLEKPYIKYNIDYTRKAFNLSNVDEKNFEVKNDLKAEDLKNNKSTIENIRINSFNQAIEFYNQVQIIRYYYGFNDIDIDRYNINGKYNQVFVAPREVNTKTIEPDTWLNKHLIYTHGYGLVMSKVNSVTSEGQPDFVIKDIPPDNSTNIEIKNPRIYFGEKTNDYAITNTKIPEFDYPKGGDNHTNYYDGKAGIKMSLGNKILFALKEKNINFLLSSYINNQSSIIINRNIIDRVKKIAPFLTYDSDPYIVANNGKLYWVIDAYTVSDRYPFSEPSNNINYIRNSIKILVDAYDGDTNFYIIDNNDPIAMSYSKIFPKLFKSEKEIPKGIKEHFRYPQDLFKIQCDVFSKYHMTDPTVFYNGEDLWEVSKNKKEVESNNLVNEAPYVVMKLPGENEVEMILLEYFNMRDKDNMVALFGVRMDNDNYGKMVVYKFPPQKTIYSPYLFKQKLQQDANISKELSLWNTAGSEVKYGDTIIVPINNSLLYVEPIYLRAKGKNSIPEMKRVIVSYGDKIVLDESIDKALVQLFNIKEDNKNNNAENNNLEHKSINEDSLKKAKELYDKAIEAQKNGDWAKYGEYIKKLGDVLK